MRRIVGILLSIAAAAAPASAAQLCGSIFSAGTPVRDAHVVAVETGAVTASDSTGRFCFSDLSGGTVTVRVFAIGFVPEERLVTVAGDSLALRIELSPLRTSKGGWSAGAATPTPAGTLPTAVAATPLPAATQGVVLDTLTDLDAGSTGVLLLYLPADTVWLHDPHKKGKGWEQLNEVRHLLHEAPYAADAAGRAKAWREVASKTRDLRLHWCNDQRPVRNALADATCAFLDRARVTALVRAIATNGGSLDRDTKLFLERAARSTTPEEASWAAALLRRAETP